MTLLKRLGMLVLVVVVVGASFFIYRLFSLGKQSQSMSPELGLVDGRLPPCGPKPNCVSTASKEEQHAYPAISYSGGLEEVRGKLIDALSDMGLEVIVLKQRYILAKQQSSLFGFVDDVQFHFPEGTSELHVRSSSRVGYSDMGANRKRIDAIRKNLEQKK